MLLNVKKVERVVPTEEGVYYMIVFSDESFLTYHKHDSIDIHEKETNNRYELPEELYRLIEEKG